MDGKRDKAESSHVVTETIQEQVEKTRTGQPKVRDLISPVLREKYSYLRGLGTGRRSSNTWEHKTIKSMEHIKVTEWYDHNAVSRKRDQAESSNVVTETIPGKVDKNIQEQVEKPRTGQPKVQDLINPALREKYSSLSRLGTGRRSSNTWEDKTMKSMKHIKVTEWYDHNAVSRKEFLEAALGSLTSVVSTSSVGAILVCAWGLVSCKDTTKGVFPKNTGMVSSPTSASQLETRALYTNEAGVAVKLPDVTHPDWERAVRSGCYLCCSLMRLLVKQEDNIINAWKSICERYRNFYQEDLAIKITPDTDAARHIRMVLQNRVIMRGTVGAFLLNGKDVTGRDKGMCRMLYELHMSFTGMQAYNLFVFCADRLKVPLHIFAPLLQHPATSEALASVAHILVTYEFPKSEEAAKTIQTTASTWRFARIFDQEIFASLQTKNCPMLVSLLARIAIQVGAGNVTQIRQMVGFVEEQREFLDKAATKAIEYCIQRRWCDPQID
ncbi:hypothetical protein QN277_018853 [Acacia crassicarpa]|uniref:Uncharacterized protein n=1 Tax=Acacia crassicarpa TaxID=499986 RepID=A0AAE1JXG6_9FABA|nr:hypothetical protein QN277_018853 [Acacia crassicarpa]